MYYSFTKASLKKKFIALLGVLIGIGIAIPLEYLGFTNLITNFGKAAGTARAGNGVNNKPITARDTIDKVQKIAKYVDKNA